MKTAPAPLDGDGEPHLGTSDVIKRVYNTGIYIQCMNVQNEKVFLREKDISRKSGFRCFNMN